MLIGKSCFLCVLLSGVGQITPPPMGTASSPLPEPKVTPKHAFNLPITFEPMVRDQIECLRLYVSTDKGKTWKETARVGTDANGFNFKATRDGHYWFILQVEDKNGLRNPRNPEANQRPDLIVIVDSNYTRPPAIPMPPPMGHLPPMPR